MSLYGKISGYHFDYFIIHEIPLTNLYLKMPLHNENLFLNKMNIYEGYYHDFLAWICQCIVKYLLHGHVRLLQMALTCIYIGGYYSTKLLPDLILSNTPDAL